MKKITKILIALGAAGIAKYIYDHVDIITNEELEEKIKKEAEILKKQDENNKHAGKMSINEFKKEIENGDLKIHLDDSNCDRVYYDNPYNISKIYLDKIGCPQIFEFENEKDRNDALEVYYNYFKDCNHKMSIDTMFKIVGLLSDDYLDFKNHFVFWHPDDFAEANAENAIPKTINFGDSMIEDDF